MSENQLLCEIRLDAGESYPSKETIESGERVLLDMARRKNQVLSNRNEEIKDGKLCIIYDWRLGEQGEVEPPLDPFAEYSWLIDPSYRD